MKSFVIYSPDERYAGKIYEYICAKLKENHEVLLFTKIEPLEDYLDATRADILLAETGEEDDYMKSHADIFVRLSEENPENPDDNSVCKYSSAEDLLRKVMSICAAGNTVDPDRERLAGSCEVIGVYSPVKRCFQTTFAITLGQILAGKRKTLYLNFEGFSGFDIIQGKRHKNDLMDLLYFSECDLGSFSYRVNSMAERIGELDYVPPVRIYTGYMDVNKAQWLKLIRRIKTETDYECLILDLSDYISGLFDILAECEEIYTITGDGELAAAKIAQYEVLLSEGGYEELLQKTKKVRIPRFTGIPGDFEMLPYSELADFIKNHMEIGS